MSIGWWDGFSISFFLYHTCIQPVKAKEATHRRFLLFYNNWNWFCCLVSFVCEQMVCFSLVHDMWERDVAKDRYHTGTQASGQNGANHQYRITGTLLINQTHK